MTTDILYKKPFLTEVIARVDFPSPIEGIEKQLPPEISKGMMKIFPIAEPRKAIAQELRISPDELRQKRLELMEWRFHGRDRDKTLTIIPTAVFVKYTVYHSYEVLKEEFLGALEVFFTTFEDAQGSRLGLRYINNIVLDNGDPLSWNDYLNERMLHLFQFYPDVGAIARVFHNLEWNFGEFNLRYQFGMHNPDYPAPIRKKSYILDLDAYYQGPHDYAEISSNLDKFHDRIQKLFELSITDDLREIMNG